MNLSVIIGRKSQVTLSKIFIGSYGFKQIASIPHYLQANGETESAVKIVGSLTSK